MVKMAHVRSAYHRTAVIDSALTVHLAQGPSDRILVSLTRAEFVSTGEEVIEQGGVFQTKPEGGLQKTFEFTADTSPDQALAIANNVIEALAKLPAEKKTKYGIPDNITPVKPVPIGSRS